MKNKIIIVDYGMGNLNSIKRKLTLLKVDSIISSDINEIKKADKIILPGVGHYGKAMENLKNLNLIDVLHDEVLVKKKPILGICLGMQLMAKKSEEGNAFGLGWFDAEVIKLKVNDSLKHKIPHIGWNQIKILKESFLMKDIKNLSAFYFVHSFHFNSNNLEDKLNETEFEQTFTSAVEKENIFGVQYHPEKSHDVGELLFKNFIKL